MAELFVNGAKGRLLTGINAGAPSITLRSGQGGLFPTFGAGDTAWMVLEQGPAANPTKREIVQATGRSGDTININRAQQGTSALAFDPGARAEIRLTASTAASFQDARGFNRQYSTGCLIPEGTGGQQVGGAIAVATASSFTRPNLLTTPLGRSLPHNSYEGTGNNQHIGNTSTPAEARIGVRGTAPNLGGMELLVRFMLPYDSILGVRKFLGLSNVAVSDRLLSFNPSGRTSDAVVGIGQEDTTPSGGSGGTWQLYHSAGLGSVTQINTGIVKVAGNLMQLRIWSPRGVPRWYLELIDFDANARYFNNALSSNIPGATDAMIFTLVSRLPAGGSTHGFGLHGAWTFG